MMMSPPLPPSPPLGPPRGTNFSRRNARQPLPPSPAFTRIFTSSMNKVAQALACDLSVNRIGVRVCVGGDADEFAEPPAIAELDDAGHLREKRVVLAASYVESRLVTRAALAYDDRSAWNQLPTKNLN